MHGECSWIARKSPRAVLMRLNALAAAAWRFNNSASGEAMLCRIKFFHRPRHSHPNSAHGARHPPCVSANAMCDGIGIRHAVRRPWLQSGAMAARLASVDNIGAVALNAPDVRQVINHRVGLGRGAQEGHVCIVHALGPRRLSADDSATRACSVGWSVTFAPYQTQNCGPSCWR